MSQLRQGWIYMGNTNKTEGLTMIEHSVKLMYNCPYCGEEAHIDIHDPREKVYRHVGCNTPGCLGNIWACNDLLVLTRAWNKRAEIPKLEYLVAAIQNVMER